MPTDAQDAARSMVNLICEGAQGSTGVLPKSLSVKARTELERSCRRTQRKIDDQLAKAGRQFRDAEFIVNGEFSNVSQETWDELRKLAAEVAQSQSGTGASLPASSDSAGAAEFENPLHLTKGSGKQVRLPLRLDGQQEFQLLLNYSGSLLVGQAQISGVGAGYKYKAGDLSFTGAVLYEPGTGNTGAGAVIRLDF